uniref:7TM GPCR domain containing protein n=1 Tax=Haemonchus contortus TaxID=6289 RepID=W6NDZ2_HAECO
MEVSIFMGIVCLVVVCGNIFVLYALISQPSLHTTTNFLVLSLTISDLLLGTAIIPFAIIQEHSKKWLFGNVGCRLWLTADVWLSTASIYNLLAISFDRYMAVRQPIRYPSISSKRVTRLLVALVWVFSGLLALCLFVLETLANTEKQECTPMKLPSLYIIFSASASFIVPAAIMVALNVSIFFTVLTTTRMKCVEAESGESMRIHRGKRKSIAEKVTEKLSLHSSEHNRKANPKATAVIKRPTEEDTNALTVNGINEEPPIASPILKNLLSHTMVVSVISTSKKKRTNVITHLGGDRSRARFMLRTELRVARTTAVVVGVFVICWFPFSTIYVLQAYSLCLMPDCITNTMYIIAFWLGYANSAVNPLIYAAFSRDFRAAFHKLVVRRKKGSFQKSIYKGKPL